MKNPIVVALDVDDLGQAQKLVKELHHFVGGFKVGPRLTFRAPPAFLKEITEKGVLFFDHKFFDIPSTTVAAVRVAAEMGAHWVTVHALNGPECMRELKKLETEIRKTRDNFRVVAVTVLTSFTEKTLPPIWKKETIEQSVANLAASAIEAGLETLVCSPLEIAKLKKLFPKSFLIVPGIRTEGSDVGDQKRTATPSGAFKAGASALVIGRSILESSKPVEAVQAILEFIGEPSR
jgi:orotidine-5'-phosphate decarboxylase